MAPKVPELIVINGGRAREDADADRSEDLDNALSVILPMLSELTCFLPPKSPYTPVIKAVLAGLRAYLAIKQESSAHRHQKAAVLNSLRGIREHISQLPVPDSLKEELLQRLDKEGLVD